MNPEKVLDAEMKQVAVEEWKPFPGAQSIALGYWFAPGGPRELFYGGARGGGKTHIQMIALAKMAIQTDQYGRLKYPTYKGAIFRYQAVDLRDWHTRAEGFYCGKLGAKPAGQPREYRFPGGPIIRSGHLQDGGYINYVGWEIHKLGIDEATHLPSQYERSTGLPTCPDYVHLLSSLRASPDGNSQAFLTGNPGFAGDRWVKQRFIKVMAGGKPIPPRTLFRDPITNHTRVFVNSTVFDNPWLMENDPGYVRSLLELPPAKMKAWLYGDWDAFDGQFFDFNPSVHVVDGASPEVLSAVPPWAYRWLSCDWGYTHPCVVHSFCAGLDKRVHVERELSFESKTSSFEVGVKIGQAFFRTLQEQPEQSMTMYLSHDAFNEVDENNRRVDGIKRGIETVLGPESCFILELTQDEKRMAAQDPEGALAEMRKRRAGLVRFGITIVRAPKNDTDTYQLVHEMLRYKRVEVKTEPDQEVIENLRAHPNAEMLVAQYLAGFKRDDEVLPKLVFHRGACPKLIDTLPEMSHDEKSPERMKKAAGDDWVDSFLYGMSAWRDQQHDMPLAYYVQHQLQQRFGDGEVDLTAAHHIRLMAEERWKRKHAPAKPGRWHSFSAVH